MLEQPRHDDPCERPEGIADQGGRRRPVDHRGGGDGDGDGDER